MRTFRLEAGICKVGRLGLGLPNLELRFLRIVSDGRLIQASKLGRTWKSFCFSIFFFALEPILADVCGIGCEVALSGYAEYYSFRILPGDKSTFCLQSTAVYGVYVMLFKLSCARWASMCL